MKTASTCRVGDLFTVSLFAVSLLALFACKGAAGPAAPAEGAAEAAERKQAPPVPSGAGHVAASAKTANTAKKAPRPCIDHHRAWNYTKEDGPQHWHELSPDYAMCKKGHRQSPIDIEPDAMEMVDNLGVVYRPSHLDIVDNGHTVEVLYEKGSWAEFKGEQYELIQFHFHSPSEHTVKQKHAAMELHLVHRSPKNHLLVVGFLIRQGEENKALKEVWSHFPAKRDKHYRSSEKVNAKLFFGERNRFYHYSGSLTTPPCSEQVRWFVAERPLTLSKAQIDHFYAHYRFNARPTQPLFQRTK
jgi:carbonic anhydrase